MATPTERPKRHAPKKHDPNFIVDGAVIPASERGDVSMSMSPPKKKFRLSLTKIQSPSVLPPGASISQSQPMTTDIPVNDKPTPQSQISNTSLTTQNGTTNTTSSSSTKQPTRYISTGRTKNEPKKCDSAACKSIRPICFAGCTDNCSGSGYTSRWVHLSPGEHFCNNCFENFYRSHKDGYKLYMKWKRLWTINGHTESNVRYFMTDQYLPYWLKCNRCNKWRQLSRLLQISQEFVTKFECGHNRHGIKKFQKAGYSDCEQEEDERVAGAKDPLWIASLMYPCFLQQSPAAPYTRGYYQDAVGLSPYYNHRDRPSNGLSITQTKDPDSGSSSSDSDHETPEKDRQKESPPVEPQDVLITCPSWSQPFLSHPEDIERALSFSASAMNQDEKTAFPEYSRVQQIYLALRNLIIALWSRDCRHVVTTDLSQQHLLCRGLVRIRCVDELPRIIKYLSLHGFINSGAVVDIPLELRPPKANQIHVIVVGAGAAGLAAARHLHNFGVKVTVLEAKNHLGGRCHDDTSLGKCVGKGAQMINCSTNNPLSMLCHQLSVPVREIEDHCDLYQENGRVTPSYLDRRIEFHFNSMLDNVAEWRKDKKLRNDRNLMENIMEMHRQFVDESQMKFTAEEEKLLQFHFSNLEYACGSSLDQISSIHWDQNELYPQFSGPHCFVADGFTKVFTELASELDIRYNSQVSVIDYSGEQVAVTTSSGSCYHGDRVVVTVPLAVLKRGVPQFSPSLPDKKLKAIKSLGAGHVEKVALEFPCRFWAEKTKGADIFGHVPESATDRGVFNVFYDIKSKELSDDGPHILLTYLTGKAALMLMNKPDIQIVIECVATLRKLFPEQTVPEPIGHFVTHWSTDEHIAMSYTHIPVGCHANTFDDLAEMVQEKVHFAGEATNRQFPQSVTGAYLSGIREAYLILTGIEMPPLSDVKSPPVIKKYRKFAGRKKKTEVAKVKVESSDDSKDDLEKSDDALKNFEGHSSVKDQASSEVKVQEVIKVKVEDSVEVKTQDSTEVKKPQDFTAVNKVLDSTDVNKVQDYKEINVEVSEDNVQKSIQVKSEDSMNVDIQDSSNSKDFTKCLDKLEVTFENAAEITGKAKDLESAVNVCSKDNDCNIENKTEESDEHKHLDRVNVVSSVDSVDVSSSTNCVDFVSSSDCASVVSSSEGVNVVSSSSSDEDDDVMDTAPESDSSIKLTLEVSSSDESLNTTLTPKCTSVENLSSENSEPKLPNSDTDLDHERRNTNDDATETIADLVKSDHEPITDSELPVIDSVDNRNTECESKNSVDEPIAESEPIESGTKAVSEPITHLESTESVNEPIRESEPTKSVESIEEPIRESDSLDVSDDKVKDINIISMESPESESMEVDDKIKNISAVSVETNDNVAPVEHQTNS